jgi:hypothetical protein
MGDCPAYAVIRSARSKPIRGNRVPDTKHPADYDLFVDGRPLGIYEAKKLSRGPQNVLVQAKR